MRESVSVISVIKTRSRAEQAQASQWQIPEIFPIVSMTGTILFFHLQKSKKKHILCFEKYEENTEQGKENTREENKKEPHSCEAFRIVRPPDKHNAYKWDWKVNVTFPTLFSRGQRPSLCGFWETNSSCLVFKHVPKKP